MKDMRNIMTVAWSTKQLRNYTIADTVKAIAKSFSLEDDEKRLLEQILIEFVLGISAPEFESPRMPSVAEALALYRKAVLSKDCFDLGISGERCSSAIAEETLRNYIIVMAK